MINPGSESKQAGSQTIPNLSKTSQSAPERNFVQNQQMKCNVRRCYSWFCVHFSVHSKGETCANISIGENCKTLLASRDFIIFFFFPQKIDNLLLKNFASVTSKNTIDICEKRRPPFRSTRIVNSEDWAQQFIENWRDLAWLKRPPLVDDDDNDDDYDDDDDDDDDDYSDVHDTDNTNVNDTDNDLSLYVYVYLYIYVYIYIMHCICIYK